ncbi:MAG: trigger factor [Armatimonadetes bacterium RBG_16_58_9]|nr:MAG: trigger factor [Armatimonadetes bacterium RBG_16_58_9]
MLVKQEQLNPCEVELQIEIEAEKVADAVDTTYDELGKVARVDGFRKGKAPRAILERVLDQDKVKDRAADKLLEPAYTEALKQAELEPWAPADVELVKFELGEPLVFKATVPLDPKVELGEYIGLDIERKVTPVTDEEVDQEIEVILTRNADYPLVTDRPAQDGDLASVEITDESEPDGKTQRRDVVIGGNLPDFDNGLRGMILDEEKVISVTYPEDHEPEDLRGKTLPFRVKLLDLYEQKVAELTDEWVRNIFVEKPEDGEESGEREPGDVDTVDKLRSRVRSAMEKAAQDAADADVEDNIMERVLDDSKANFPTAMLNNVVNGRIDSLLEDLKKRKATLDDYLKHMEQTFEEMREEFEEDARKSLKALLVMKQISEKEGIQVEDDDVEDALRAMAQGRRVPVETMRAYVDRTDSMSTIRYRVRRKKLMDFLVHASNIRNVG